MGIERGAGSRTGQTIEWRDNTCVGSNLIFDKIDSKVASKSSNIITFIKSFHFFTEFVFI